MVTLTESYFSVDMELNAAHIHYTNVACGTIGESKHINAGIKEIPTKSKNSLF